MSQVKSIPAAEMLRLSPCTGIILDVRTKPEHTAKHLSGNHVFVPLDNLEPKTLLERHGLDENINIYTMCQSGSRAQKAAKILLDGGIKNVQSIEGGINALETIGFPIEGNAPPAEQSSLSIERQVRIGAGALVLLSLLLAFFIHPVFLLLALFVSAGLVFAGVTNFCGMALLLMRAPWNANCTGGSCSIGAGAPKGHGCQ